uniref:Putative product n=1 Tax=Xenopsylla cheopis TaxID=163159 RepID=A0A6M2DXI4_XENCH
MAVMVAAMGVVVTVTAAADIQLINLLMEVVAKADVEEVAADTLAIAMQIVALSVNLQAVVGVMLVLVDGEDKL